jgi:1-acyl-sn-glycerol-3-phosphate acyltransferase
MRLLLLIPRCLLVVLLILLGLSLVWTVYPISGDAGRDFLNRTWSRCLLWICAIEVRVLGTPHMRGAVLVVSNHVSWIDIFVINSVRPTAFVAKSEIRRWPIVGGLVAGAGTLFLDRSHRHAVTEVANVMQQRFKRGEAIGLYPEGTTSEGYDLLPFHASLFEPARLSGVAVQPIALRFLRDGRRDGYAAFVGEETLVGNLWRVLRTSGLAIEIVYLPLLPTTDESGTPLSRTELSRRARDAIRPELV